MNEPRLIKTETRPGHEPHVRVTRRHQYIVCTCGWDIRTAVGVAFPWWRWQRHLDEVGA